MVRYSVIAACLASLASNALGQQEHADSPHEEASEAAGKQDLAFLEALKESIDRHGPIWQESNALAASCQQAAQRPTDFAVCAKHHLAAIAALNAMVNELVLIKTGPSGARAKTLFVGALLASITASQRTVEAESQRSPAKAVAKAVELSTGCFHVSEDLLKAATTEMQAMSEAVEKRTRAVQAKP